MKLKAFNIKNYRSIVDSGWNNLSPDNITGLIGQNESGKTTIMEALISFYNSKISDDILRSDLSMPVVSCSFSIDPKQLKEIFSKKLLPEGLSELIEKPGRIAISRIWHDDKSSRIEIGEKAVIQFFKEREKLKTEKETKTQNKIENILKSTEKAICELNKSKREKENVQKEFDQSADKLAAAKKAFNRSEAGDKKNATQKILEVAMTANERIKNKLSEKIKIFENKSFTANELIENSKLAKITYEAQVNSEKAKKAMEDSYKELCEVQKVLNICITTKEKRAAQLKLDITKEKHVKANLEYIKDREEAGIKKAIVAKVFEGKEVIEAEKEVLEELKQENEYYSLEELGQELFKYIPKFELFGDFSSLLPNRIDLEALLNENSSVEGFKAAKNFLIISGLDASFFEQKNNRILKQKIEKLNNKITINFQDYWRQSVGKSNKIQLHFELEHYDFKHTENKGKPYLEFWIKDEQERLYPKQRSRGVRWFLSFYLELKATAKDKSDQGRIILIDEPGLSLHARAQEDVLKVLEDIKENIQIIYTTHSPHLIDLNKLYRLLAVQRAAEDDDKSETLIFDAKSLHSVSTDTLSAVYTLMGLKLTEQQFIRKNNNVIIEDISTYYYLTTFLKLINFKKNVYFLPATGVANVPTLVNLLLGWRLDFIVLLDDDESGNKVYNELKMNLFDNDEEKAKKKLIKMGNFDSFEDLFSTIDFKKYVLQKRIGITEKNSEYIDNNNLPRPKLASDFLLNVQNNKITFNDFDEETQNNVKTLILNIKASLS